MFCYSNVYILRSLHIYYSPVSQLCGMTYSYNEMNYSRGHHVNIEIMNEQ